MEEPIPPPRPVPRPFCLGFPGRGRVSGETWEKQAAGRHVPETPLNCSDEQAAHACVSLGLRPSGCRDRWCRETKHEGGAPPPRDLGSSGAAASTGSKELFSGLDAAHPASLRGSRGNSGGGGCENSLCCVRLVLSPCSRTPVLRAPPRKRAGETPVWGGEYIFF